MKLFTLNFLVLFLLSTSQSYGQWMIRESGTTAHLLDVEFITSDIGIATGYYGLILRTTDGGITWTQTYDQGFNNLESVEFINQTTGWIMGQHGTLLYSTDQGASWHKQSINTNSSLRALDNIDENKIWLVGFGGALFYTEDQGNTWIDKSLNTGYNNITDVKFLSESVGIIAGTNNLLKKTTDAGDTWNTITSPIDHISEMFFIDDTIGWIAGFDGVICKTTDAGDTWQAQISNTTEYIQSIFFLDANVGYAAAWNGTILVTEDGGTTWTLDNSPTVDHLVDVDFLSSGEGWMVGSNGVIISTMVNDLQELVSEVSIAPNPMSSEAVVQLPEDTYIDYIGLYNVNGQLLHQYYLEGQGINTHVISRGELTAGLYLVHIKSEEQMITRKLVVR
jgi:photosystem II stability/assembly factor-like uncharacterized protein